MKILVLNCGISSAMYSLFAISDAEETFVGGMVERIGLVGEVDSFDPVPQKDTLLEYQLGISQSVGLEAHGDSDTHLAAGVNEYLFRIQKVLKKEILS